MGDRHEADIVRLASEANEQLFPVHRIDKVTTGVVLFAKNLQVHGNLTRQFNKRTVDKRYLLITQTTELPAEGVIDLPLTSGRKGIVRVAAPRGSIQYDELKGRWHVSEDAHLSSKQLYPSLTRFATLWSDSGSSLVLVEPYTGRKQQIRIHFAWIGHPIFGDPLFDKVQLEPGWQTCLHSWQLGFNAAWREGARMEIEAAPPLAF
jgi:tRNA pseudouridine32 synthase/23S rRNA pseudouridine746 synthase/23S rRNA pseudouridine1911/1915/1917 synthase